MRNLGLSANQLMHIPGAGDFEIERMEGAAEPSAAAAGVTKGDPSAPAAAAAMETEGPGSRLVVLPDEETRERLVRENDPDPLAGDQTWPTEKVRQVFTRLSPMFTCTISSSMQWQPLSWLLSLRGHPACQEDPRHI